MNADHQKVVMIGALSPKVDGWFFISLFTSMFIFVDPVRQAKTGFSIDLKRDQHVKEVSNM